MSPQHLSERILDRFVRATFAIDRDHRLLYSNAPARALTRRADIASIKDGRLIFADRALNKRLAAHTESGLKKNRTLLLRTAGAADEQGGPSIYRVLITPMDTEESNDLIWMLFVSEPRSERYVHAEVLRQIYGLTRTESLLVSRLFSGNSLGLTAEGLDISINTAKTHLRQVFRKCDVQSQAELLQLVALGPRAV
jgi:DNA-binding CsgD family transcriptional regulator